MSSISMKELVNFCKKNGYIFQGSEIYNGLSNTWDYGPLGVELKNNIKKIWWKKFIQESKFNVGLDSSILMNPNIWKASGHLSGFSDPLIDCKSCKSRFRADKLIENHSKGKVISDGWDNNELLKYLIENKIKCEKCGEINYSEIRNFNLMFKTQQGVIEDEASNVYLRPETAQGIFVNFQNIQRSTRKKIPFGVGQIGKSFRNEITPGNFIFRTREFEQMELEFFCKPGDEMTWYKYWKEFCYKFLIDLNFTDENIKKREHDSDELSHYSNATMDFEYKFPWGFGELWGIASRTNYDLNTHQEHSKNNLEYLDPFTQEKYLPFVIEPSVGVDRLLLALLLNSYNLVELEDGEFREVLKLHPVLAPYKVGVLPLIKKLHSEKANEVFELLCKEFSVTFDDSGKIGKRYRRQDSIGTPICLTIDDESLNSNKFTLRDRDTMLQKTVHFDELVPYIKGIINF